MGLANIRTKVKETTDRISDFANTLIDSAANEWQLEAWLELDKVAQHLTRKRETKSLVAGTPTYQLDDTDNDFLVAKYIQPPDSRIESLKYIFATEDNDFHKYKNVTAPLVAWRLDSSGQKARSFIIRPTPDASFDVVVHYTKKPATITTSVDPTWFQDEAIWPGVIWKLLDDIDFVDADKYRVKAREKLQAHINLAKRIADNSNLTMVVDGFPYS